MQNCLWRKFGRLLRKAKKQQGEKGNMNSGASKFGHKMCLFPNVFWKFYDPINLVHISHQTNRKVINKWSTGPTKLQRHQPYKHSLQVMFWDLKQSDFGNVRLVNHIYTVSTVIRARLQECKPTYACFVDLKKGLWLGKYRSTWFQTYILAGM